MTTYPNQPMPLSILDDAMNEEFRSIVVKRALDWLDRVSAQARLSSRRSSAVTSSSPDLPIQPTR